MTIIAETLVAHPRRMFCLTRLASEPPITYDQLVREVIAAFPAWEGASWQGRRRARLRCVRAVRWLLWDGFATTIPGELVVLTAAGREALERGA